MRVGPNETECMFLVSSPSDKLLQKKKQMDFAFELMKTGNIQRIFLPKRVNQTVSAREFAGIILHV